MNERLALTNARNISASLRNTPEVQRSCHWIESHPNEFAKIATSYLNLVGKLETQTDSDMEIVSRANELMSQRVARPKSESHVTATDFLNSLSREQKGSLRETMGRAFDPETPQYQVSLTQLADMMYAGHELFSSGGIPRDGDPVSDRVIWGHTQARADADPKILAHFIVSHYLARYAAHVFPDITEVQTKDGFLAALIDVVLLEEARKPRSSGVLDIWMTPREIGGLGWLVPEYLDIYREVLEDNKRGE